MFAKRLPYLLFTMCMLLPVATSVGEDVWPQFRGPTGDGHVVAEQLPIEWSEEQNVTWKVPVVGAGYSSPVIADGRIWLTTAIVHPLAPAELKRRLEKIPNSKGLNIAGSVSMRALCFDAKTGELQNNIELFHPKHPEPIHATNTYASPTPVLAAGRAYFHFGTYGTACVDSASGEVLWKNDTLHVDHQNGPGSSPIIWNDLLIVHFDGTDRQFVAAFDTHDGRLAWSTERSGEMDPRPELQKAYCTPTIVKGADGPELISPAANWVYGYDPRDGSELWKASYGGLGFSTVPRPVVGKGLVFICTSFMKSRLLALRLGGRGDKTGDIVWTAKRQIPQKPSILLAGDELYVANDAGILTCFDASTGKQLWRERLEGKYAASPLLWNDLVYFFNTDGKTSVLRAGKKFDLVSVNQLDEGIQASPAVADNALFIRTTSHLYRIEQPRP